jgi:hypothetical protein
VKASTATASTPVRASSAAFSAGVGAEELLGVRLEGDRQAAQPLAPRALHGQADQVAVAQVDTVEDADRDGVLAGAGQFVEVVDDARDGLARPAPAVPGHNTTTFSGRQAPVSAS